MLNFLNGILGKVLCKKVKLKKRLLKYTLVSPQIVFLQVSFILNLILKIGRNKINQIILIKHNLEEQKKGLSKSKILL